MKVDITVKYDVSKFFLWILFIKWKKILSIPNLLRVFSMNRSRVLSNAFSESMDTIQIFLH